MPYRETLEILSDWAAILTATVATVAYARFYAAVRTRQKAVENYLRDEKIAGHDRGRRTVLHLMAVLKMTEGEVFQAGFRSNKLVSSPGEDDRGRADCIFFEYAARDVRTSRPF